MADEIHNIKVKIDDSEEKKYYTESEGRRKKSTTAETEAEKRKTASLKGELKERYAVLKASLNEEEGARKLNHAKILQELDKAKQKELEAERQGNRMKIKEAIQYRKILESQLRLIEQDNRLANAKDLSEFRHLLKEKERLQKQYDASIRSAPRTVLKGDAGSLARLGQMESGLKLHAPGTDDFVATEKLINRTRENLNKMGVDTRNLSQKIGGEFKGAISQVTSSIGKLGAAYVSFAAAQKLWSISEESAKFHVLKENFRGTTEELEALETATAGNVTKGNLIKLSNQASDLGVSLEEQTILMSLAEDASDKYGTSLEEGFQKVIFATEGSVKGLKSIGIQKAVYEEIVKELAKAHGDEIENLDAETQKQIRLEAIIKASGVTYDMAIQKQKDLGDKHEIATVFVGNLKDEYGKYITTLGLLDEFMNKAVKTGNRQIEILQMTKIAIKNIADEWGILKREAETPIKLQIELSAPSLLDIRKSFNGSYEDAVRQLTLAKGISWEEAQKMIEGIIPSAKENEANSPNRSTNTSSNSGSKTTEQIQKTLTFLEAFREKIKKLQEEIASLQVQQTESNLADYEKVAIYDELIAKQKELNDLMKVGGNFGLNAFIDESRSARGQLSGIGQAIQRRINPRSGNDPRQDMSSEEIDALLNGVELSFDEIKGIADSIVSPFQNILQLAGLTESAFGQILNMIRTVLDTGSGIFGAISSIISFIPGAGAIGAIGGMAGGAMSGGMPRPQGMNFSPTVIVNSEVEKTKSVRFYGNTLPEYNRRQAVKSL